MTAATNSVAASPATDIRDIKPPIEIPNGWEWLWILFGALAILVILFFAWKIWKKHRANIPFPPPIPAHIRAKQKLQEALALIPQPKEFCILVSDTIRFYLEERFQFRAPERTTEEFLRELGETDLLSPEQKESLGKFLESCDLVKFAKYEPGENELRELHGSALRLVEETEPQGISNGNGSARVSRAESGVAPDSSKTQKEKLVEQNFRRDAENSTPETHAPQSEIENRES